MWGRWWLGFGKVEGMRGFFQSGAWVVVLFLAGLTWRLIRDHSAKKKLVRDFASSYESDDTYEFYRPVRQLIVPKDEWKNQSPDILAALWCVDEILSNELPPLAADLLERGLDGKYLRRLAGEKGETRIAIAELAEKAFGELGVRQPISLAEAKEFLVAQLSNRVLNGEIEPAKAVLEIAWLYEWHSDGLSREFVLLNYSYEHLFEHDPLGKEESLDEQVRAACAKFLTTYSSHETTLSL